MCNNRVTFRPEFISRLKNARPVLRQRLVTSQDWSWNTRTLLAKRLRPVSRQVKKREVDSALNVLIKIADGNKWIIEE